MKTSIYKQCPKCNILLKSEEFVCPCYANLTLRLKIDEIL